MSDGSFDRTKSMNPAAAAAQSREVQNNPSSVQKPELEYADFDTERAVLACILSDPDCMNTVMTVFGGLQPISHRDTRKKTGKKNSDDLKESVQEGLAGMLFRDPRHAAIFQAVLELNNGDKNIRPDILSVQDALIRKNRLEQIGGLDALLDIQASVGNIANLESWCNILVEWAMLREMIHSCSTALQLARTPGKMVRELLDEIEANLFAVRNSFIRSENKSISDLMEDTFQYFVDLMNRTIEPGIPTGYADLDNLLGGGLKKQEMIVLAARPSIGKTAFALNIARNIAMKQIPDKPRMKVAFFSLEMSAEQVAQRLLCTESHVPLSSIMDRSFNPNELYKLTGAVNNWSNTELYIDPTGGLTIFELRAKARKLKDTHGIDIIIIDYLQLMRAGDASLSKENRQVEVAAISGAVKKLAKDLDVPVLVLSQLNREVESTPTGKPVRPKLSNIRESGSIEQDADVVIFLHRDRDESKENKRESSAQGVVTEVIVEKNRNGKTGEIKVMFHPSLMEFRSITHKYDTKDIPASPES